MIANPWVMLAIVIGLAVSHTYAFVKGGTVKENAVKAKYSQQLETEIAQANANAVIDMQAAAEHAAAEATAQTRAATIRSKGNEEIRKQPLGAMCDWNPATYGVLVDGIKAANGDAPGAGELSAAVRKANGTGQ